MKAALAPGALATFLAILLLALPAAAADEALALRIRASQLAAEGHCPRALELLGRARARETDDARSALLTGQCLLEGKHYGEALPYLHEASRLDPSSGGAALLLGVTSYQIGQLDEADEALERAEKLLPDNAEVALYRGLVLLELARSDEASERFDRAARISPTATAPIASYYGGLAHRQAGRNAEAEVELRRTIELAPNSAWAVQAQAALDSPAATEYELRQWLTLRAGVDFDSNVALIAEGIPLPPSLSNQNDGRGVWSVEAGTEIFRNEKWGAGVLADYFGAAYFNETEFNQQYVGGGIWVDRSFERTRTVARLQPLVGFSWFDLNSYLNFYGFRAEVAQDWQGAGLGQFFLRYSYDDYRYPLIAPTALQRAALDRDGHSVLVGYDHFYRIADATEFRGGVFERSYSSKGTEWDLWGVGIWAGIRQQLPLEFTAELKGGYEYDHYDHPSLFLQPTERFRARRDHIGTVSVEVERPILPWLTATARWHYFNSASNTQVYDYDRHIVGVFFTAAFGD